jgi:hypothetical protein
MFVFFFRFPVILSIEDHCPLDGQCKLAQDLREILGEMLLTEQVICTKINNCQKNNKTNP